MTTKIRMIAILSIFTASLAFAFSSGNGTPQSPYVVSQQAHLALINNNLSSHYVLGTNLILSETYTQAPIAPQSHLPFTGTLDGNGFNIYDLTINAPSISGVGLFGYVNSGAVIKNLGIVGVEITGRYNVGALIGKSGGTYSFGSYITDCYATGNITANDHFSGGLVGTNKGNITNCYTSGTLNCSSTAGGLVGDHQAGVISRCYSSVSVGTSGSSLGGLVGRSFGDIEFSHATGSVSTDFGWYIGGLVGENRGKITSCDSVGSNIIIAREYIGGLVGQNYEGTIVNCFSHRAINASSGYAGGLVGRNYKGNISLSYATGSVSASSYTGGLVGENYEGTVKLSAASGSVNGYSNVGGLVGRSYGANIDYCYATGSAQGNSNIGGLVGLNDTGSWVAGCYATGQVLAAPDKPKGGLVSAGAGSVVASFWDTQTCEVEITHGGGEGLTTAQMKDVNTYLDAGWDFVNESENGNLEVWYMPTGDYPKLYWYAQAGDVNYDEVVNINDLRVIAQQWLSQAQNFERLTADINGNGYVDMLDFVMFAQSFFE